jgi:hypothetical protein
MSYSKSHVILIAFAIDTPDSLENVQTKVRPIYCFDRHPFTLLFTVDRRSSLYLWAHYSCYPRWLQSRPPAEHNASQHF